MRRPAPWSIPECSPLAMARPKSAPAIPFYSCRKSPNAPTIVHRTLSARQREGVPRLKASSVMKSAALLWLCGESRAETKPGETTFSKVVSIFLTTGLRGVRLAGDNGIGQWAVGSWQWQVADLRHRCSLAIQQRMILVGARRRLRAGERVCASMVDEAKATDGEAVPRMDGGRGAAAVPSWGGQRQKIATDTWLAQRDGVAARRDVGFAQRAICCRDRTHPER